MKKLTLIYHLFALAISVNAFAQNKSNSIDVNLDLINIDNDRVKVHVTPPKISTNEITYHIPKIIPGTYSEDDYGQYIENFKAFDVKGNSLPIAKLDVNSWKITNAKKLAKITYLVNDTYDIEETHEIFSPAGTNIDTNKNFMINTHGFVGYFSDLKNIPYKITIDHPKELWGATAMIDQDSSDTRDIFQTSRYAELTDMPIMYSKPNFTSFTIQGMEIILAVYSPSGKISAESLSPEMKKMVVAQKNFLADFDATKKYAILLYLSTIDNDAQGFGALEHPTSTTVVMPEMMPVDQLLEQLKDVVSHEFFHIVTPLTIHSKEIHDFDYNTPKMSQHLWMYEGVTEYFANLFQINQDLISENEFYMRMAGKIADAAKMNDTMPFTKMSANILSEPYKEQYLNVYQKGALIAMCIDIIIREKSDGKEGILTLMKKLSKEYGIHKPFNDDELFAKITALTYPEVGSFLSNHLTLGNPIDYSLYFSKMGVAESEVEIPGNIFAVGTMPVLTIDGITKEILFLETAKENSFMQQLKVETNDRLISINDVVYNLDNINDLIDFTMNLKDGDPIKFEISRNGEKKIITDKVNLPKEKIQGWKAIDSTKEHLKNAWLKG